jgi:hypothetical protein
VFLKSEKNEKKQRAERKEKRDNLESTQHRPKSKNQRAVSTEEREAGVDGHLEKSACWM